MSVLALCESRIAATFGAALLLLATTVAGLHSHGLAGHADPEQTQTSPDSCALCQVARDAASVTVPAAAAPAVEIGRPIESLPTPTLAGMRRSGHTGRAPPLRPSSAAV